MTHSVFQYALLASLGLAGSLFFSPKATAQNTSELGVGLGGTNYKGEISPQYQLQNNRPAFTVFYRKDVSVPITLRGGFTAGLLRAADDNVNGATGGVPPLQGYRLANMKGSLLELSGVVEYNFLNYHNRSDFQHYSPYVFIGLAGYYANISTTTTNNALSSDFKREGSRLGLAIPAGVGLKIALSEFLNLGLEVGVRKLFTDQLDHLSDQDPVLVNSHDQDWYYYNGISLSYTFYKIRCPTQYKNNDRLLR